MSSGDLSFHRRWSGNEEIVPTEFRWNGRPLVVIDPEDREKVERLAGAFCHARWDHTGGGDECDPLTFSSMQAALCELATPKPPKPEEPTGLGAVVEDSAGTPWVRCENADLIPHWYARNKMRDYADITAVRILSEGVQA